MNWQQQYSAYRTFQAESEVAIKKYNEGWYTKEKLHHELRKADEKLTGVLNELHQVETGA